jgi:hypothetical protein
MGRNLRLKKIAVQIANVFGMIGWRERLFFWGDFPNVRDLKR